MTFRKPCTASSQPEHFPSEGTDVIRQQMAIASRYCPVLRLPQAEGCTCWCRQRKAQAQRHPQLAHRALPCCGQSCAATAVSQHVAGLQMLHAGPTPWQCPHQQPSHTLMMALTPTWTLMTKPRHLQVLSGPQCWHALSSCPAACACKARQAQLSCACYVHVLRAMPELLVSRNSSACFQLQTGLV